MVLKSAYACGSLCTGCWAHACIEDWKVFSYASNAQGLTNDPWLALAKASHWPGALVMGLEGLPRAWRTSHRGGGLASVRWALCLECLVTTSSMIGIGDDSRVVFDGAIDSRMLWNGPV